ncbi:MAG: hypothetical protein K6A89_11890 [Treponema sp.]|nr:hypothetical protein [Treponema sp.]
MKNISFKKILLSFGLLFSLVAFNSCIDPNNVSDELTATENNGSIIGTWESSYGEKYVFSSTEFKNYYTSGGNFVEAYTGNNLYIKKLSSTSGYIYLKYTKSMMPDNSYSTSAPDVGKWYAAYYYDLTDRSVKISAAYKSNGVTSTANLAGAVSEFTVANGYFASDSTCVKSASGSGTIADVSTALSSGSSGVVTTSYYVRRSYTDPSDPTYSNTLEDNTYWDVLVYNSANPLEFTEVTYPVQNNQRVREVYTWAKDGDYFYLLDEDDEPVNGALLTISNNSITRKAAISIDYLDYLDYMFCEEVFELVTDESLIPTAASYDIPATRTLADCVEAGSYCVPGWCNSKTTFSLLLVTEDKKAIWYYYGGGSRNRKEYNLENYSDEGTTIESDGLAVQFSPEVDDDTCQIRFKNSSGTWSSWHLTPYSDCGVVEMMNSQRSSDFLCLTKFGAFGFVRSSRDGAWGAKNTAELGTLNACSESSISTVRITSSIVYVSILEEDDWGDEEEVSYGTWSVTENSNITISELFNQLQ